MKGTVHKLKAMALSFCVIPVLSALALAQQPAATSKEGSISPAEALNRYKQLLRDTSDPNREFYLTTQAAGAAWAAGDKKKAKGYARSMLGQADTLRDDWNYGNAIHIGNLLLGLVALDGGDVKEAKRLLLEAGKSRGSPQLGSFGPNMRLAKALLEKGERQVVVMYLDLCARFWSGRGNVLQSWKTVIIEGGIPDFGSNLDYGLNNWRFENWTKLKS